MTSSIDENSSSSSVFLPADQCRLVTIAAHVDHGKTTLADNLIELSGMLSERLAGTVRYLDSDPEEQRRGITIRAAAVALRHAARTKRKCAENYTIHLLDSPGHTDFSQEVSSSLTACDGAVLVLDAVEGMGARTHQVMRETFQQQHTPVLVINKVDRLCTDLMLTPTEAYVRLRTLLETVNAAASSMLTSARQVSADLTLEEKRTRKLSWTFDPAAGNVIFGSALYGWGFTCQSVARSLFRAGRTTIKPVQLKQFLFGDYRFSDTKDKILKWKSGSNSDPIFAEVALQPIWDMYEGVADAAATVGLKSSLFADGRGSAVINKRDAKIRADTPCMDRVLENLQMGATGKVPASAEELQSILTRTGASTEEAVIRCILRRYRPLAETVLDVVCELCPSPVEAASSVRSRVLSLQRPSGSALPAWEPIQQAVSSCSAESDAPSVAHVCKFMGTDRVHIADNGLPSAPNGGPPIHLILGLTRVLSGRLRTGQEYYLMGPKHQPGDPPVKRRIRLYQLMGSSFQAVDEVPAGHLCAVYNLEDAHLKTVTLCDSPAGMPVEFHTIRSRPLVKVNVEPENAADTRSLEQGLRRLRLADAAVEVTSTSKGERLLACVGELHLEQSLLDLVQVYCSEPIKLRVSDPIVDFAETTDWFEHELADYAAFYDDASPQLRQTTIPPYSEEEGIAYANHGRTRSILSGRCAAISLRVIPLSASVHRALKEQSVVEGCEEEVMQIGRALNCHGDSVPSVLETLCDSLCSLDKDGNALLENSGLRDGSRTKGVESDEIYVPLTRIHEKKRIDKETDSLNGHTSAMVGTDEYNALRSNIRNGSLGGNNADNDALNDVDRAALKVWKDEMKGSAVAGFQLAVRAGPICEEPMRNVMVVLEGVEVAVTRTSEGNYRQTGTLSGGMVVAALRSGIRCALLSRPARLMEGHLRLTLHSSLAGLGALYPVLNKRRGKVLDDTMVEGTDLLMITASLPQAEAFGLAPELYGKTSGEVTAPEMVFSHWARLDVDPFWIPTSEEEREDFGELRMAGDSSTGMDNTALSYIRKVRLRKGLMIDSSRTILSAEKQRTLKR
jgi:ribosome assembly protein 1